MLERNCCAGFLDVAVVTMWGVGADACGGACRGSYVHGRVSGQVLPDGAGEEASGGGHVERVLPVRRPEAGGVHVVALHLGAAVHVLLVVHDTALGA